MIETRRLLLLRFRAECGDLSLLLMDTASAVSSSVLSSDMSSPEASRCKYIVLSQSLYNFFHVELKNLKGQQTKLVIDRVALKFAVDAYKGYPC